MEHGKIIRHVVWVIIDVTNFVCVCARALVGCIYVGALIVRVEFGVHLYACMIF